MNDVARTQNPFGAPAPAHNNAVADSESARAVQEVQAAMVIAKKFPRNQMEAVDRIINACSRPTLAEKALYVYARGGTEITGPSIRLAEAIAQEWGNMQFGIRELSSNDGMSTVEAFAWDVQTNTRQVKIFQVPHVRYTRANGNVRLNDPRDIYEMIANQGARRLRACILGVIPGDVVETAVNQCHTTQAANIDTSPEGIKKMLDVFQKKFGVSQELIEQRIQRRVESITPAQMQNLLNIAQSIRDGMSKPADWFDMDEQVETVGPKSSDINQELKAGTGGLQRAQANQAPPEPNPTAKQPEPQAAEEEAPSAEGLFGN